MESEMKMQKRIRILIFIACVIILFSYISGSVLNSFHECSKIRCQVCDFIQYIRNIFDSALAALTIVSLYFILRDLLEIREVMNITSGSSETLVDLKVKLSD